MNPELTLPTPVPLQEDLHAEVIRLRKINKALMDRAERSTNMQGSDYAMFQATIMLEDQVRARTKQLYEALKENERITHALKESAAKFRSLVDQSLVGIAMVENDRYIYANSKFAMIFGYSSEELLQMSPVDNAIEDDRVLVVDEMRRRLTGESGHVEYVFRGRHKDGSVIDIECHSSVIDANGHPLFMNLILDITQRLRADREVRALHDKVQQQAIHDPLTGLFNRQYLTEAFDRELQLAESEGHSISIVLGDIDHFKEINDTYGHLAGDEALKGFARAMRQVYRSGDILCRYGGDEFIAILPGMENELAYERTQQLRNILASSTIRFGADLITTKVSFGVATFPQNGRNWHALISAADQALYLAKEAGRNQVYSATSPSWVI